jgi:phosphoenolpyruvate synthase/pyruvate phosphate dikinase
MPGTRSPGLPGFVYEFAEGSKDMRDRLGGKGASVVEMTRVLGAEHVPAGFTITTEACGEGVPAVTGAAVTIDTLVGELRVNGQVFREGDVIGIDGTEGAVAEKRDRDSRSQSAARAHSGSGRA